MKTPRVRAVRPRQTAMVELLWALAAPRAASGRGMANNAGSGGARRSYGTVEFRRKRFELLDPDRDTKEPLADAKRRAFVR